MIKYKDEIMSRPKSEWHKTFKQKKELRKESNKDLSNIKDKFDAQLQQVNKNKKKREKKREEKAIASNSKFAMDREGKFKDSEGKNERKEGR